MAGISDNKNYQVPPCKVSSLFNHSHTSRHTKETPIYSSNIFIFCLAYLTPLRCPRKFIFCCLVGLLPLLHPKMKLLWYREHRELESSVFLCGRAVFINIFEVPRSLPQIPPNKLIKFEYRDVIPYFRPIEDQLEHIMNSDVYKILHSLPKGGNMHSHESR